MEVKQVSEYLSPLAVITRDDDEISQPRRINHTAPVSGNGANFGYDGPSQKKFAEFVSGSDNGMFRNFTCKVAMDASVNAGTAKVGGKGTSFFKTIGTKDQRQPIADYPEANLWARIMENSTVSNDQKARDWESLGDQLGLADADRITLTTEAKRIIVPLNVYPWYNQQKAFPLCVVGNLRHRFDFAPSHEALATMSADCDYYILSNLEFIWEEDVMENAYVKELQEDALAGKIIIPYMGVVHKAVALDASSNVVSINDSFSSAMALFAVNRLTADLNPKVSAVAKTQDPLNKYQKPNGTVVGIQVKGGSNAFPSEEIRTAEEVYVALKQVLPSTTSNQLTRARFNSVNTTANSGSTSPLFIVGLALDKAGRGTGFDNVQGNLNYIFKQSTPTAPGTVQCDLFVLHDIQYIPRTPVDAILKV